MQIKVGQNAQGVFEGVVKGVTRALFGRRAPVTPQLKRALTMLRSGGPAAARGAAHQLWTAHPRGGPKISRSGPARE